MLSYLTPAVKKSAGYYSQIIPMYTRGMPRCNIFVSMAAALLAGVPGAWAESVYVRVNQVGYETGKGPFRAYLMSKAGVSATNFKVVNSAGQTVVTSPIGVLL